MSDASVFVVLVLSCAAGVTAHVSLVWGLAHLAPRWRALVGLLCPPLAPLFGASERLFVRSGIWLLAWGVYLATRLRG